MKHTYDEAIDKLEKNLINIIHIYGAKEGCSKAIEQAIEELILTGDNLDSKIDDLQEEVKDLKSKIEEYEDKETQSAQAEPCFYIKIQSLKMQNDIENFIVSNIYPNYSDRLYWEIKGGV